MMPYTINKHIRRLFLLILSLFIAIMSYSCAPGQYLKTSRLSGKTLNGTFRVIYYGNNYANDPETAVFFDIEGDQYVFEPYAPAFKFVIKAGVPADKALADAQAFVSSHSDFFTSQLSSVLDNEGRIIGYELRPLYHIQMYGFRDILDIYYRNRENKVQITVDMKQNVIMRLFNRDSYY